MAVLIWGQWPEGPVISNAWFLTEQLIWVPWSMLQDKCLLNRMLSDHHHTAELYVVCSTSATKYEVLLVLISTSGIFIIKPWYNWYEVRVPYLIPMVLWVFLKMKIALCDIMLYLSAVTMQVWLFPCMYWIKYNFRALNNWCVCLHGSPGWNTLTRQCEIQPARLPCLSTSTSRPPSCTRSSSWARFSCSTTASAQFRWWRPHCYGFFTCNLCI